MFSNSVHVILNPIELVSLPFKVSEKQILLKASF